MTPQEALTRAIEVVGSTQLMADELKVTKAAVSQWKLPGRQVPAEHCPLIERLVDRQISCEQLRPDIDWAYLRVPSPTTSPV